MKRSRRRSGVLITIIIVVFVAAGVALFLFKSRGTITNADTKQATVVASTPTTAFSLHDGVLPANWSIGSGSINFLNLMNKNGCFTTSTLSVADDYQNITSVDRFKSSFAVKFTNNGYTIANIATRPLKVTVSGTQKTIDAIYYELTQNNATTYHIDGGIKGLNSYAFMSVSCTTAADLDTAQSALLTVTYNDSYKPVANATNQ